MRAAAFLVLALLLIPGVPWAAAGDLQQRQEQARRDREALRDRIRQLEKQIAGTESSRRDVTLELKKSETAISELDRRLASLETDTRLAGEELNEIQRRIKNQTAELERKQQQLAAQLRAQYAGGLSPWATLLSGEDPQDIARELGYLEYVARAQADAVRAVHSALEELNRLQAQAQEHEARLKQLAEETAQRRAELEKRQAERQAVLARIEKELKQQRSEARNLANNEAQLAKLVDALAKAIEEEAAEARRRAEEARRLAEERRLAEQRRLAEERRLAEQREKAEATRRAEETQPARPSPPAPTSRPAPLQETAPLNGLQKGLPYPVRGEVQGRFGMERPEGGIWRGIVLRAKEGASVTAVAPGRVVYAGWLGGFGNLLILDHGAQYLSVYAYNQGLLRQVGDHVRAGEAIATVGSTGGQVEPGLYFEIRHGGKPVNPLLWLGK